MTRAEAIVEERRRYLKAILESRRGSARRHLKVLRRLRGNGYCVWERHADRTWSG
ncbi:hypothetical protein ACGFIK_21215 [Micromonospora sp. NPDC048871]|uniref:hypothetical protein n=1 Tax=unclassified Micromonospora TaxID=2617518 RepID=UPI002E0F692E|nr:hypothetical protein OIE53_19190 [Micromonospora sp. NBC_01739]